jgi:cell division transport system ATP-binding protein
MIRMSDVFKVYANGTRALKGVTFSLDAGEFAFLVGPSGSGKSTVIKLVTGEIAPTDGQVIVNGYDLNQITMRQMPYLRRTVGVIFQDFRLIDNKTVYDNVSFAMRVVGASSSEIRVRVPYVLELVGLEKKAKARPQELSGGEQQRVVVARALINNPALIVADEPTGNLDPARSLEIITLLQKINELGTTVLVVTHEKPLVDRFSQRVIAIDGGRIISDGIDGYYNYEVEQ